MTITKRWWKPFRASKLFYLGPASAVPGQFQVITLIHSLEHIAEPAKFLAGLCNKLVVGACLSSRFGLLAESVHVPGG
jgi:fumarate reductase subunit C